MRLQALFLHVLTVAALPVNSNMSEAFNDLYSKPTCDASTRAIRKEWGAFTIPERAQYIKSVKCMMKRPSQLPKGASTAAKTRLDDYVATHINQTLRVHVDGIFLAWHRHFTWTWEQELRKDCGYNGSQPYWDWPLWADNLKTSPLFDDSPTSFSGDGLYNASGEQPNIGGTVYPKGSGGGCVVTGPFANRTLTFRNFDQNVAFRLNGTLPADALDYAPHCFRRDLNTNIATKFTTQKLVDYLIKQSPNISDFQSVLDNGLNPDAPLGPHGGGHYTAGPDMFDFFTSPNDPVFFLHHGMVDLLWTRWQARNPSKRQYALSGGSTLANSPPSPNVTLDYELDFNYLTPKIKLREVMDVRKGRYCYAYQYSVEKLKGQRGMRDIQETEGIRYESL